MLETTHETLCDLTLDRKERDLFYFYVERSNTSNTYSFIRNIFRLFGWWNTHSSRRELEKTKHSVFLYFFIEMNWLQRMTSELLQTTVKLTKDSFVEYMSSSVLISQDSSMKPTRLFAGRRYSPLVAVSCSLWISNDDVGSGSKKHFCTC